MGLGLIVSFMWAFLQIRAPSVQMESHCLGLFMGVSKTGMLIYGPVVGFRQAARRETAFQGVGV